MEDCKYPKENALDHPYKDSAELLAEGAKQFDNIESRTDVPVEGFKDLDEQLDLTCKRIAYWNFKLVPMFEKVDSKELIPTSSDYRNGVRILCVETPIISGVYGKAIFQLSDKGINNYFIAYISSEVTPSTVDDVCCNVH